MVTGESTRPAATTPDRPIPSIVPMAVASLVLVVTGGIYLAAYLPQHPPLAPAVGLLAAAGALVVAMVVRLSRLQDFAWDKFFLVARWTLLAYIVIAGMIGYVFVLDGTSGNPLIVLILMLVVFAVDIPLLLAFSVARYQSADE